MATSQYGPFEQIDFPATRKHPGGSTFEAKMPVDCSIKSVREAVTLQIPTDLSNGFARLGANFEVYTNIQPVATERINRELGLLAAGYPVEATARFERQEFTTNAIAQHAINYANILAYLEHGKLIEYSVAGLCDKNRDPKTPLATTELFASLYPDREQADEYHLSSLRADGTRSSFPDVNRLIALDFLHCLSDRQSGLETPDSASELDILTQLWSASDYRFHEQEGAFRATMGIETASIIAKIKEVNVGKQVLRNIALSVDSEMPSGDSITFGLRQVQTVNKPKTDKQQPRVFTARNAYLSMAIFDSKEHPSTPEKRAASFNSIFNSYRAFPENHIGAIANAAAALAIGTAERIQ